MNRPSPFCGFEVMGVGVLMNSGTDTDFHKIGESTRPAPGEIFRWRGLACGVQQFIVVTCILRGDREIVEFYVREQNKNGCGMALALIALLSAFSAEAAGPAYPLKLSANKHYLVDQNNTPFFIQGDAGWYVIQRLNALQTDTYLSNRWAQGFNSIMLDLQSHQYGSGSGVYPCADAYGNLPFTNVIAGPYTNFLSVNPSYYTNADYVIQRAAQYGINVFLFPLYAGYQGQSQGWYADMVGNGTNRIYQFGQFIGQRYKSYPNIIWVLGGDYAMPDKSLDDALAAGILSQDTTHLITAHAGRNVSALDYYTSPWDVLNSTYTGTITYQKALADYQRSPVAATFLIESYYEGATTALGCRQEAWGAILSGCAGHIYGSSSLWQFNTGWETLLWSPGATTITNIIKLMNTIPWYNCVPDANHTVVTGGYGTWGNVNYVTAMREASGTIVVAYIPQGTMTPTVDLTQLSGVAANASWYNPRTGATTAAGTYNTTGSQTFTPPDANDWVLLLQGQNTANTPPTISAVPDQDIRTNASAGPIPFTIGDSETPAANLIVWAASSNPALIPTNRITFGGSGSSRTVTLTPNSGQEGTANITLGVSDGSATATTTFPLTVHALPLSPGTLSVDTNGLGAISPAPSDQTLTIGKTYTLTAIPGQGYIFAGWTGSYTSSDPKLTFLAASNVVLKANFTANPFMPIAGTYNGLYREADEVRLGSSGFFSLSVTSRGTYSGRLQTSSGRYAFKGKLNPQCQATNVIVRNGTNWLTLSLTVGTGAAEADEIVGRVTDANWSASLRGDRALFNANTRPSPYTNRFTIIIPGREGDDQLPAGDGIGTMLVDGNGRLIFKGTLADGTRVNQSVPISGNGLWPLYCPLYSGGGSIWSWVALDDSSGGDVAGAFTWIKTADAAARFYPAGFDYTGTIIGSVYRSDNGPGALNFTNALVEFSGGNIGADYFDYMAIDPGGHTTGLGTNQLALTFALPTGSFSGRSTDPFTGKASVFRGVVLQKQNAGRGFLLGTNRSSRVLLEAWSGGA